MIWTATGELAVSLETCWFVGDTPRRDIACARRARAAKAILMPSPRTATEPVPAGFTPADLTPDAIVPDGFALADLLSA
jgi:phosphoglycolate phosphatase-like HAD superfamily hydrolase